MAYSKTTWTDRIVEKPNTYTETGNPDGSKTFTPAPGQVIQPGTTVTATLMNKLEQGVYDNAELIQQLVTAVGRLECPYGVGDYYITESTKNPKDRWAGTTWEKLPAGTFLVSAGGGSYALGNTGGEATHTLTSGEMPKHQHSVGFKNGGTIPIPQWVGIVSDFAATADVKGALLGTTDTGNGQPHNNIPPYKAVNIYKRTA